MSIQTELTRITNAKAAIKTAVEGKGVTVPDGTLLDGMAALIESIEAGGGTIYTESIIPAEAQSADLYITHNLGVVPNFAAMYTLDDDTSVTDHAYLRVKAAFCTDVNDKNTICGGVVYRKSGAASYNMTSYNANIFPFTSTKGGAGLLVHEASESRITFTKFAGTTTVFLQAGKTYNILVAKL